MGTAKNLNRFNNRNLLLLSLLSRTLSFLVPFSLFHQHDYHILFERGLNLIPEFDLFVFFSATPATTFDVVCRVTNCKFPYTCASESTPINKRAGRWVAPTTTLAVNKGLLRQKRCTLLDLDLLRNGPCFPSLPRIAP